ncbi:MAG TPA: hypothetical protein VFG74_14155 [Miltoncostaeaceae bacterium]|nr:hypothetical protein [Miltoncostaeaceae bacterium]
MRSDAERRRLADDRDAWLRWGPYLSERAWGTVREDYSPGGTAWEYLPHDHARSRAYRWSEDGLGGICDDSQRLCFAWAFWNGRDPILKERVFGLTGNEGNHGEDAKEYWWYLDSTPTHSWMRWRYVYPQGPFPYADLLEENRRRGREGLEYELLDTGAFDEDRYWDVEAAYAKAGTDDICIRLRVRNAGPDEADLHVLPTLWFRNRWSWTEGAARPWLTAAAAALRCQEERVGAMTLRGAGAPEALVCDNDTNTARLFGVPGPACPKDGINDHVVAGAATVSPAGTGTKGALWYRLRVEAGGTRELRLRLSPDGDGADLGAGWEAAMAAREAEADAFHGAIAPAATEDEARVMRQAFAGMLWGKQFFNYDVGRWLDGDPTQPPPPPGRARGRNHEWRHLRAHDVISMPDKWEYPWFAAWDLAFHTVALAHVDPEFSKEQLILMCREWYMHPNGAIPAYEWAFSDVNPPVHAWAALRVFRIDGSRDRLFLERIFQKLLLSFAWWTNRKDEDGDFLFAGGFLGLDNIGPFDRSAPLPPGVRLEQADGTGWMAIFALNMLEMALVLAAEDPAYEDMAIKFFVHFGLIARALETQGLWNEEDGFLYDRLARPADGATVTVRARSMTGLIPLCAVAIGHGEVRALPRLWSVVAGALERRPALFRSVRLRPEGAGGMVAALDEDRLRRVLSRVLDDGEFLSPYGLRALSAAYRDHPYELVMEGRVIGSVGYEPAESRTGMFGGNSNWRGPVWFPVNHLVIEALDRYGEFFGDAFTVEHPTGSGHQATLAEVADDLRRRLIAIFLLDEEGRRPCFGEVARFRDDPAWRDALLFHEYFHGDLGCGLGASHQTGWTGLVADLIVTRAGARG